MAGHSSEKRFKVAQRRAQVAAWYVECIPNGEMAQRLGVSPTNISQDLSLSTEAMARSDEAVSENGSVRRAGSEQEARERKANAIAAHLAALRHFLDRIPEERREWVRARWDVSKVLNEVGEEGA